VSGAWLERRARRAVRRLRDHYVICGYGRVRRRVADEFRAAGVAHVVIGVGAPDEIRALEDMFGVREPIA